MIYFFRWIFGYVRFTFKNGFAEDFLTDCFSNGIELRDIKRDDHTIAALCGIKYYKRIHRIALAHGGKIKIIKKHGLPFILKSLKNRLGFWSGALCFCIIISFFSTFIWNVEITGNSRVSTAAISEYLNDNGISSGSMWGNTNRDKICWDMMSKFDDFSWVHINKIGCTAKIEINETSPPPNEADENKLQGIDVFRRELSVKVGREQKRISVKSKKDYLTLHFFTINIPLYTNKRSGDQSSSFSKFLKIRNVELPIGYTKTEEIFYNSVSNTLTDDQLKKLADKRLGFEEEKEFDGFEIVNKTKSYNIDESGCTLNASYVVRRK